MINPLLLLGCLLSLSSWYVYGQNYSGLQNKNISLVHDAASLSTQLFPEVTGSINRVFVRFDGEEQLKVVMQYAGYENTFIRAEVFRLQNKNRSLS